MTVTHADRSHLDALAALFDGYRQFYRKAPDLDAARAFLADRFEADDSVVFVAGAEGRSVGFTQLYPLFSSVRMRRVWLLNDLYVAPEARRAGVGRALMEAARVFATDDGAVALQLATEWDNASGRALYESLGYRRDTEFATYEFAL